MARRLRFATGGKWRGRFNRCEAEIWKSCSRTFRMRTMRIIYGSLMLQIAGSKVELTGRAHGKPEDF